MTDKEKRQQRHSAEDAVFNRMLLWLLGVVVAEAVILLVKRFYIDITADDLGLAVAMGLKSVFSAYSWIGLVLSILGAVWCWVWMKKGKNLRLPGICTAAVAFLWVVSLLSYYLYDRGVDILVVLPIVAAVLVIIFFLYQRVMFVNAIITGCGMAALWCMRQFYNSIPTLGTIIFVVFWLALIAVALVTWMMKKSGGKLNGKQLVQDKNSYLPCIVTCAVVLVITVLGFILGGSITAYLIYVLIGWLFCLAVYYTVRLM